MCEQRTHARVASSSAFPRWAVPLFTYSLVTSWSLGWSLQSDFRGLNLAPPVVSP